MEPVSAFVTQEDLDAGAKDSECPFCELGFVLGQEFSVVTAMPMNGGPVESFAVHSLCITAMVRGLNPRANNPVGADGIDSFMTELLGGEEDGI